MKIQDFLTKLNSDFFTGVPDSLLRPLCDYLMDEYGEDGKHHVIAANEGNAVGLAAGYHLATGGIPVIYMQNSGEGNAVNPIASLLNEQVYGIPAIFIIGWRGEPGVKDEPQHAFQGEITISLLKELEIKTHIITAETTAEELEKIMTAFNENLKAGRQVAFVIEKDALTYDKTPTYSNDFKLIREDILRRIVGVSRKDIIVATTGKTGRELFELREEQGLGHENDFLTVGSMGHASSIALGIALQKPKRKVWCIDGDGAALMHMGAMAVIGKASPNNLIHVVINNKSHESVGALPTAAGKNIFSRIARDVGYKETFQVSGERALDEVLSFVPTLKVGPVMIEIECAIGSRPDLGRPTISPKENKKAFMNNLIDEK